MTDDERAIREVIATWLRAAAAGDTANILTLMADDVVFLVPGQPPFGKEVFAAAQDGFEKYHFEATSEVRELRVSGDWAYCWHYLAVVMTPLDGGGAVRKSGNILGIFQRLADGRWALARDANLLMDGN
jgi:uncharacterized protein (TIGR02246 family)